MRTDLQFSTFPQGQFCGNARPVENSCEFTTSLLKTLRVSNIPTKTLSILRYIFCYKLVKVYADLPRKFIRLLTRWYPDLDLTLYVKLGVGYST